MTERQFWNHRGLLTGLATLYILTLLLVEHFNGGVVSHHLLNSEDMPAISNWWGALVIPLLSWFLLGLIGRRISHHSKYPSSVLAFVCALAFGVLLSVLFVLNVYDLLLWLLLSLPFLALFFPIYRGEYVLGLIFGMSYVFGGIIPVGLSALVAVMASVVYLLIRPLFLKMFVLFRKQGMEKTL